MKTQINQYFIVLISFLMLVFSQMTTARSAIHRPSRANAQVQVQTRLSQTKLVQHGANAIFLDVTLTPPTVEATRQPQRATDMIIVLDRSGSMSEAKKMPYAKAAIWDVLGRLNLNDRFALISFADNAIVQSPLVSVSSTTRDYLNNVVSSIQAGGGTNMGEALNAALSLLNNLQTGRVRKIILLSDGQANQGITNPEQLAQIAAQSTRFGAVLSTIGMGLDFNEQLMAQLADYGMGHYSYLEDLSGLNTILAKDLEDSRQIYAHSSHLNIVLQPGVQLLDAGGYPLLRTGSSIQISTGQLLANSKKHFVMSLIVPNQNIGTVSLGHMYLNYQRNDQHFQNRIDPEQLMLAVVSPEQRIQALKSIDKDIYQKSWQENNLGLMKRKLSGYLRLGNKTQAKKQISLYKLQVDKASEASDINLASPELKKSLEKMEQQVDDVFSGRVMDQQVKRNRAAKRMQYDAISKQRK